VKRLKERLAYYAGFLVGGLWFLFCSALGILWLLLVPRNRQTLYMFGRVFCRGIARLMGWRMEVANRDRLDSFRPCVFIANHQSFLDLVAFGSIFPRRTVSAGKREIGRIPVFGWFYRLSGNLVLDRGNPRDARDSLDGAARTIRGENVSVWLMPEGHRNQGRELLPFKSGAFRLALAAGVPVVPIVAEPLTVIADTERRLARPGTLKITVLEPIPTDPPPPGTLAELVASTRARMQAELDRLRRGR
jgi:1-acyl-sn-glycerol-3-phosphate acyltransferase